MSESGPEPPTPAFVLGRNHHERHAVKTQENTLQWILIIKPAIGTAAAQLGSQAGVGGVLLGPGAPLHTWAATGASPHHTGWSSQLPITAQSRTLTGQDPPAQGIKAPSRGQHTLPGEGPPCPGRLLSEAFTATAETHTCTANPSTWPQRHRGRP